MPDDPATQLRVVQDPDGRRISLGDRQTTWLLERGFIHGAPPLFTTLRTVFDLNDRVMAEPSLRECDFCRRAPAAWTIRVRPFEVTLPPAGPSPIGDHRPMVACDECAPFIDSNRKADLVEHAVDVVVTDARAQGILRRDVPLHAARNQIRPMIRGVVYGMFANRRGRPVRA